MIASYLARHIRSGTSAARITTLAVLVAVLAAIAVATGVQIFRSEQMNRAVGQAGLMRGEIQQIFVLVQGAETAQRGFLLTGQDKYLAPYETARTRLSRSFADLRKHSQRLDGPELATLSSLVTEKMAELEKTIALKRAGRSAQALALVSSGRGYDLMSRIYAQDILLQRAQTAYIDDLLQAREFGMRLTSIIVAVLLGLLILFLAVSVMVSLEVLKDRNQSVRQLTRAKYEADQANKAKSEFLASMSHELRTPLNAILGFSEVLKKELFGPIGTAKYAEYADDIHKSGSHLLDLINDVLDLSKVNAGRMELREQEVSLASLFQDCLSLVRGRAQHVRLQEMPADELPHIWADARLMKQLMVNLLSNAIKFTPPGGTVSIGAEILVDRIRISVSDTGIGMDDNEIAKAMSEYGQVDSKVARDHQGTGLGLPICKSLAELHGGTLAIASRPGAGTTVSVLLPRARIFTARARAAS